MQPKRPRKKHQTSAAILFAALFVAVLSAAFILGRDIFEDLDRQRTASSDNVQWTLTQVEVEYLSYLNALEHFAHDDTDGKQAQLSHLRKRFDVFYSRVDTLRRSPLFAQLRDTPEYSQPLSVVYDYLIGAIPSIDTPSLSSGATAQTLLDGATTIQDDVRALSLSGLSYFATLSDTRRAETTQTLTRLGMVAVALLMMLLALAGYLFIVNRRVRQRGRALRQANTRVRTVMATSLDAIIVVNSDGNVLEFNPAAEQIFGHTRETALGQSIGTLIVPDHLRDAHSAGMERMKTDADRHVVGKGRVQLEAMRANGDIFPVELALESAFSGHEEIVIGYIRDISNRVAAQEELISARDKALAGEKAKDNFLTVMSHEIRTPLNGLIGNLSLLTNSKLTIAQRKLTQNMQVSGEVLMSHVDSVLDIARFEAGKLTANSEAVNLNALMQDIVDGQSGNAASNGNAIEWQWVGPARAWVLTDEQRLRQILLNLVGNAIKFTQNGRISIEVECSVSDDPVTPDFEFRVIDTGIGMTDEDQLRVFEDFETSDPSISRNVSGTGLGLGIARRFVSALGGEIGVESAPGEGSVFWVRMPLEITLPSQAQADQLEIQDFDDVLNVLVVEDNDMNAEVLRGMLELDNHIVTLARNGEAGVEAAEAHRFDVILMDISMPVMDGPTAARHIRMGYGLSRDAPIIAVSANVLPGAVDLFREAGMNGFVGKPLTVEALRHALSTILQEGSLVAEIPAQHTDALHDLKTQLGPVIFTKQLGKFVSEADELMQELAVSPLRDEDAGRIGDACHKLAGSAGIFGLADLHRRLITCETHLKEGRHKDAEAAMKASRAAWADARLGLVGQL